MKKNSLSYLGLLLVSALFFFMDVPSVFAAESELQAGDLIRVGSAGSIYILDDEGYRHLFPTRSVFYSWFGNEGDATIVDAETFMSYKPGRPVTMRPATSLLRFLSVDGVFAVERDGVLRKVADELLLEALYGKEWGDRVVEVSPALWSHYRHTGEDLEEGYPIGTFIKGTDDITYYIENSVKRKASAEVLYAWRFNTDFVLDADDISNVDEMLDNHLTGDDFGDADDEDLKLPY